MSQSISKSKDKWKKWPWIILFFIVFLWLATWPLTNWLTSNMGERGTFGDMFGSINALFSGLALLGIIYTVLLQRDDLKRQNFESSFFQLLTFHHKLLDGILFIDSNTKENFMGGEAMQRAYKAWSIYVTSPNFEKNELFNYFVEYHSKESGHYFRNMYHVVKYIDGSNIRDKKKYIGILRAQLSHYEQAMLFYNCLTIKGIQRFKPLVEKYALLENMDYSLLISEDHILSYNQEAFGDDEIPKSHFKRLKELKDG